MSEEPVTVTESPHVTTHELSSAANPAENSPTTPKVTKTSPKPLRRIPVGTRLEDVYPHVPISLDDIDSAFALQEYLQSLIRTDKENLDLLVNVPEGQDADAWQYEHLRQLCLELGYLVVQLLSECTRETCREMKTTEFQYLCATHPKSSCSAMDYIVHTLDQSISSLNDPRLFPSRMSIPATSLKNYQEISRRLYRIFAHAYFHHREIFEAFEIETFLYARFLKLSTRYKLVSKDLIIIPEQTESNGDDGRNRYREENNRPENDSQS
ncbi:11154_t:CDS:2 [Paraglomus brasilianum]|uniref:11154_t:CDS:1 n=1 Tax=Paraglomus brasilianum TaxID=144538 RepID=A0A9N8VSE0_9GLOM|nr:11154_t:CDS:2 [Paraglomus brasilianum]